MDARRPKISPQVIVITDDSTESLKILAQYPQRSFVILPAWSNEKAMQYEIIGQLYAINVHRVLLYFKNKNNYFEFINEIQLEFTKPCPLKKFICLWPDSLVESSSGISFAINKFLKSPNYYKINSLEDLPEAVEFFTNRINLDNQYKKSTDFTEEEKALFAALTGKFNDVMPKPADAAPHVETNLASVINIPETASPIKNESPTNGIWTLYGLWPKSPTTTSTVAHILSTDQKDPIKDPIGNKL